MELNFLRSLFPVKVANCPPPKMTEFGGNNAPLPALSDDAGQNESNEQLHVLIDHRVPVLAQLAIEQSSKQEVLPLSGRVAM